jgi:hypothetical protein
MTPEERNQIKEKIMSVLEERLSMIDDDSFGLCVKCRQPIAGTRYTITSVSTKKKLFPALRVA